MNGTQNRWPIYLSMVLALWLIVSPFILYYYDVVPALTSDIVAGVLLAVLAWGRLFQWGNWAGISAMVLGAYLLFSPFFLGYSRIEEAYLNNVVLGLLTLAAWTWNLMHPLEEAEEGGPVLHPTFTSTMPHDEERER